MSKAKTIKGSTHDGHQILNVNKKGSNANILDKANELFDCMLHRHKALFTRMDIHYPHDMEAPADNRHISRLCCDLSRECRRKYGAFMMLWAREQTPEAGNPHFHTFALSDGRNNKSPIPLMEKAEGIWAKTLDLPSAKGLIDRCDRTKDGHHQANGIMLRKDDPDYERKVDDCRRWASYLAKCDTKQNVDGVRNFGGSEVLKTRRKD